MGRQLGMLRKPSVSSSTAESVPAADLFLSHHPLPILFLMTFFPSAVPDWYYQNGGPSSCGCLLGGPWGLGVGGKTT